MTAGQIMEYFDRMGLHVAGTAEVCTSHDRDQLLVIAEEIAYRMRKAAFEAAEEDKARIRLAVKKWSETYDKNGLAAWAARELVALVAP